MFSFLTIFALLFSNENTIYADCTFYLCRLSALCARRLKISIKYLNLCLDSSRKRRILPTLAQKELSTSWNVCTELENDFIFGKHKFKREQKFNFSRLMLINCRIFCRPHRSLNVSVGETNVRTDGEKASNASRFKSQCQCRRRSAARQRSKVWDYLRVLSLRLDNAPVSLSEFIYFKFIVSSFELFLLWFLMPLA